jgi:two-component system response regulator NreC
VPGTHVLVLTMHHDEQYLYHVWQAGREGYVVKSSADTDLLSAIRTEASSSTRPPPRTS